MKTVSKKRQYENQVMRDVIKELFELQLRLEAAEEQSPEMRKLIELMDHLFEKMMFQE